MVRRTRWMRRSLVGRAREGNPWWPCRFRHCLIALFVTLAAVLLAPAIFVPSLGASGSFCQVIHTVVLIVTSLVVPVTTTMAFLRYRLRDIDGLINRALVYGSLTLLLAAVYFGGV